MTLRKVTPKATIVIGKKNSDCAMASLAYCLINFGVFVALVINLPCENSILLNFSSSRGVAILDCESHSQAGSTRDCSDNQR